MKIYCSGIGGIGLSSYASLQNAAGHTVLGSDRADSALLDDLRRQGITVFLQQDGSAVPEDADLFVYSEAIPEDAPERQKAKEFGIPQQSYFKALGELSKEKFVIAVCGTHGKSSTVAMAARVLLELGIDATIQVGTKLKELDGRNWRAGNGDIFLLEACEYRRSFHHLSPDIVLMTNVDGDHFDAFADVEEYQQAFREFLEKLPPGGPIVTHLGDPDCRKVVSGLDRPVIDADSQPLVKMLTPGRHMQENAQLVLALAGQMGWEQQAVEQALQGYAGSWRRMELKGKFGEGIPVIDDYGHHPREVRATLQALKERYPDNRLLCIFQPHTHDRTLKLYDDFAASFGHADQVIVTDVYEARKDIEREEVDLAKFAADIAVQSATPTSVGGSLDRIEERLRGGEVQPHDVILCLGAGTITNLAERLTVPSGTTPSPA